MSFNVANPALRAAAVVAVGVFLAPSVRAQGASPPTVAAPAPKKAKAKSTPGQWAFAPENETSSKLAWQYTPGESEFLAISISCDTASKSIRVTVDLATETQAKPGQKISAEVSKGTEVMMVAGKVENGESGPFVSSAVAAPQVVRLLSQPGEVIVLLPHHRMSLSAKSLAGPSAAFAKACQLRQEQ